MKIKVLRITGGNCGELGREFTDIVDDLIRLAIFTTFDPAILVTAGPDMNAGWPEVTTTAGSRVAPLAELMVTDNARRSTFKLAVVTTFDPGTMKPVY